MVVSVASCRTVELTIALMMSRLEQNVAASCSTFTFSFNTARWKVGVRAVHASHTVLMLTKAAIQNR
jgi:hypothetical protein